MSRIAWSLAALVSCAVLSVGDGAMAVDAKVIVVPPGNRAPVQPDISNSSIVRTAETRGSFEAKFTAIYESLASQPALVGKIVKAAATYNIDPIHMIGAIVGEHTYNVDVMDSLQGYYIKAMAYLNETGLKFAYDGERIDTFVARPQFAVCADSANDYEMWSCRDRVWRTDFQGQTVDGKSFPDDRFTRAFFQPFFAGQTFGLGQMSPIAALMVSDVVHAKSKFAVLDMKRAPQVYRAVMDPDMTLHYMAALIARDIETYKAVANFDISQNPGITATLYNTGDAAARAAALAEENRKRRAAGQAIVYPRENFYGWLINDRLDALRKLLPVSAPVKAEPAKLAPVKSRPGDKSPSVDTTALPDAAD